MPLKKNFDTRREEYFASNISWSKKILLPPIHIKLGLIKQFEKFCLKMGHDLYVYVCRKFPHLSEAKLKEEISVGPDSLKLMFVSNWVSFK